MTNCLILHGCPKTERTPEECTGGHWLPWLRDQLNAKGIKAETPLLPEPWNPVYENFKKVFEKYEVNEDTILVGHSCAGAFLIRWLGETKKKVSKLILVAPWRVPWRESKADEEFYLFPIDETVKERVGKIVMFIADNEEEEGKEGLEIYHKAIGGEVIELKGKGHFTFKHMKTKEFPELLEKVLAL